MTRHRASYDDAGLLSEVLDLLSTVFPVFREQEQAARRLGLRWESCSTPFVYRRQGRVVAHVGLLEMPLQMNGRRTTAGSVHGVATHPELRRRGYFRSLMEELLGWCDEKYETLQLCTDNPEYFESFGFRIVEEHHFVGTVEAPGSSRPRVTPDDPALLRKLLARREPVSNRLGVLDRNVFLFNEARHRLVYCEELQTVLSCDLDAGRLVVWDVVNPQAPIFLRSSGNGRNPVRHRRDSFCSRSPRGRARAGPRIARGGRSHGPRPVSSGWPSFQATRDRPVLAAALERGHRRNYHFVMAFVEANEDRNFRRGDALNRLLDDRA